MATKKKAAKKPAAKKAPAKVKAAPVATPNEVDLVKENEALKLEVARLKQRNRRKL